MMKVEFIDLGRDNFCDTLEVRDLDQALDFASTKLLSHYIELIPSQTEKNIHYVFAGMHKVGTIKVIEGGED